MSAPQHGVAGGDWDSALQAMDGHILQSTAWQRVQQALGHRVLHARGDGWSWAGAVRGGLFPRYVYAPCGPTASDGGAAALRDLAAAARTERLDFARAEPAVAPAPQTVRGLRARQVRPVQPRHTWVLDIDAPLEQLRRGLSAGHRGSINAAPRRGLSLRASTVPGDVDVLLRLRALARSGSRFDPGGERYHRTVAAVLMPLGCAVLYIAEAGGEAVAAAYCFDFGPTRYYAQAASDPGAGRRLGAAAPLVWQMILDARERGQRRFDFWGVQPGAPAGHPWAGFSAFKMAFGGRLESRAGTWELPARPLRHAAYSVLSRR